MIEANQKDNALFSNEKLFPEDIQQNNSRKINEAIELNILFVLEQNILPRK